MKVTSISAVLTMIRIVAAGLVAMIAITGSASSQSSHEAMRRSLVSLKAEGIGGEGGTLAGQRLAEEATGVVISTDGLILTTYHLIGELLEKSVDGQTVTISANLESKSSTPEYDNVTIINSMPLLDLLLLKLPPGADPFVSASIGSADSLKLGDPVFTSGFPTSANYTSNEGILNNKDGPRGFLWTVTLPFVSGQSGSPVYNKDGLVVGIAKGNDNRASNQNYMIPIQFADPLIAHLRMAAFEGKLAKLSTEIDPLRRHLEWTGRYSEDGKEVLLGCTKLIASDVQIKKVTYNAYLTGGGIIRWPAVEGLKEFDIAPGPTDTTESSILMDDLGQAIERFQSLIQDRPIEEIRLVFKPTLSTGETLPSKTVIVEPRGRS